MTHLKINLQKPQENPNTYLRRSPTQKMKHVKRKKYEEIYDTPQNKAEEISKNSEHVSHLKPTQKKKHAEKLN